MKNIDDLFKLFAGLTLQFQTNPEAVYQKIELLKDGKNDALIELLKTKFFCGTKLIDEGIIVKPYAGPENTNQALLEVYVSKAKEKGHTMYYNHDTTGYDDDIKEWGFLDEPVTDFPEEIFLPIIPAPFMTEKVMFEQAKLAKKEYLHSVSTATRTAITLLDMDFYSGKQTNGSWTPFFLKNKRKSDNVPCGLDFGLNTDGKLHVDVRKVNETFKWNSPRVGFPLSNMPLKA